MIPLGTSGETLVSPYVLDPVRRVLHGPDAAVEVAPHVARLLVLLARKPGAVMPYAKVLAACYAGAASIAQRSVPKGETPKGVSRARDGGASALKVQLFRARRALLQAGAGVDIRTIKRVGLSLDAGDLVLRAYTPEQAAVADASGEALASPMVASLGR